MSGVVGVPKLAVEAMDGLLGGASLPEPSSPPGAPIRIGDFTLW
jgi:hypothetical protein